MNREHQDPVGNVAEEAAKLFEALAGSNGHIATGSQECRFCPLCQAISALRQTRPEVTQHLAAAATSLAHAVSELVAPHVPETSADGPDQPSGGSHEGTGGSRFQRIDLDEGPEEDW